MSKVNNIAGIVVAALVTAPTMLVLPTNGWAQSIEEITVTIKFRFALLPNQIKS